MSVSYSQLQTYRRCPKQYEYAFVKKLPKVISAGESFGTSMHGTLQKWGELEAASYELRAARDDQISLFEDHPKETSHLPLTTSHLVRLWHQSFIVEGHATRLEADYARNRGEKILTDFFAWWSAEERTVIATEKGFKWQLPETDVVLSGRFDRIERTKGSLRIIDFKTGEPRDQASVDADLQLSIYALAAREIWDEPVAELSLLFLREEGVTEQKTTRNDSQLHDAETQMRVLIERMRSGDVTPLPEFRKCAMCPYKNVCPASAARGDITLPSQEKQAARFDHKIF